MAITWTNEYDAQGWLGLSYQTRHAKGTPAASDYATGGYTITPSIFGLTGIRDFIISGVDSASSSTVFTTAYYWQYNHATGKLQVFGGAASGVALAEVNASTDLSAFAPRVFVTGY